jgi:hypothetical protein
MTKVKGSKEFKWRVVKYQPVRKFFITLGFIVLIAGSMQGVFWFGKRNGVVGYDRALNDLAETSHKLSVAQEAEQVLRQEIANATLGTEVDRRSVESVRLELMALKTQVAELEEENQFYRNLMSPEIEQRGLSFGQVELFTSDKPRAFRFKVLIQQLTAQHEQVKGVLNFFVVGKLEGKPKTFSLHELSPEIGTANIKLNFTYFQKFQGVLTLPDGFEPQSLELKASANGDNATAIDKHFDWSVRDALAASPRS